MNTLYVSILNECLVNEKNRKPFNGFIPPKTEITKLRNKKNVFMVFHKALNFNGGQELLKCNNFRVNFDFLTQKRSLIVSNDFKK